MKKKKFAIVLIAVLAMTLVYLLNINSSEVKKSEVKQPESESASTSRAVTVAAIASAVEESRQPTNNPSPPVGTSQVEKWKWFHEMGKNDRYFPYKAPISFYGKVIDDAGNTISGVSIDLSWTDANEATGASQRAVISDEKGLFSIEGVHGNSLSVMNLAKPGYNKSTTQNKFSFNYGYFPDPYYHSPDPMNPVVFVMRKKRQGEAMIVRTRLESKLESGGQGKSFPIGAGDVFVSVQRLPDEAPNARYWNARVTVPDGGLQLTKEEFPYEAPEDGYANEFVITNGLSLQGNQGGMFYVKTPKGYGRVMVYYVPNMPWIYAESWFNPNPNSRNLEIDPSNVKVIKP